MRGVRTLSRSALAGAVALAFCFSVAGCGDTGAESTMTTPAADQQAKIEAANKATMDAAKAAHATNKAKTK